jgi:hypothetical protein
VDRLRSWGRRVRESPWLLIGAVAGFLLICAWIAWAVHVSSEHSFRQGLGALLAWAAIGAILGAVVISLVAVYLLISPREEAGEVTATEEEKPEPAERDETEAPEEGDSEPEAEAAAG